MEEVKRNDLIFFRNEVLEDIKKVEMNINDKISNLAKQLQNANLINEQKFGYYQDKYDEMLIKLDPTEFQNKIKDKIDKFGKKIEETTISNNVKIQKMEKDLANSCYKYDKIYLKNMSSPGLIGDGCPYPTMKSFFVYLDKKIKQIIGLSDKTFNDFNSLKIYLDKAIEDFVKQIDKNAEDIDKNNTEKLMEYEKKLDEKKKYLEDRFEHIRIENSQYIYGIIKSQEIINERLKVELKKYSLINESLIKYYTNKNKTQKNNNANNNIIKNELNKKTKSEVRYLFNTKSSKKIKKKMPLNLNEILPAVKKIEDNFNLNEIINKNKDLKDLKIRVEDNFLEIDNEKKDSFSHKNILKTNKSLFLRRSTMGISKYNPNKLYNNFNLFNNETYKTIFHSNKNNLYKTEEKKLSIDEGSKSKINIAEFKNTNSEKKILITEDNIIPIKSKKSLKEEKKETIEIKEKSDNIKKEYKNKITITLNVDNKNKNNNEISNEIGNEDIIINKIKNINNEIYKKKEINENKDNYDKKEISFKSKGEKKEKEILVKEYEIMNENENKNDIKSKNNTISYLQTENTNKNVEIKFDKKINKVYKYINRNNDEIEKKLEIINSHINYLLKEIMQISKDKKKLKNNLTFNYKDKNNNVIGNINLNNLYISNNSIIPIKSYELTFGKNEKTRKLNSSDNNTKIKNNFNRIINTIGQNKNETDNYGFILNKIEPYLIKKFQNS